MKKIFSLSFATILFGALFFTSCKKNETPAPTTSSTTGVSSRLVGNWYNSENKSSTGPATYPVVISAPNSSTILFTYLYGFHTNISANVINNSFTIPSQTIEGLLVSGSGVLTNPNLINMTYVVNDGLSPDNVTATLTK